MTVSISAGAQNPDVRRRRASRAAGVAAAAAAAWALWVVAVPVGGVDLAVGMGGRTQPVGLGSVLVVSLAAGLVGWALLAVLERRSGSAVTVWTAVALGVLVLSLLGPVTSAVGVSAGAVLAGMHVLVAAVVVPALRRTSPDRS
jgi:Family of unknown function (DUF6069)